MDVGDTLVGDVEHVAYQEPAGAQQPQPVEVRVRLGVAERRVIRVFEKLGEGSFGAVYRAQCEQLGNFALKVCSVRLDRVRVEICAMGRVCKRSNAAATVAFHFGAVSERLSLGVIAMELCLPLTVHEFLVCDALPPADVLHVAHRMLTAVDAVHAAGCVHHDIKLQNFTFDAEGGPRLIDYGLAAVVDGGCDAGAAAGTPAFMAPECAQNALAKLGGGLRMAVGQPADVWSLGVVFFCLATRCSPYPKQAGDAPTQDTSSLLRRVANAAWVWPPAAAVQPELRAVIEAMLQRRAEDRPTAAELLKSPLWRKRSVAVPAAIQNFLALVLQRDESDEQLPAVAAAPSERKKGKDATPSTTAATTLLLTFERKTRARLQKQLLLCLNEAQWRIWHMTDEATERAELAYVLECHAAYARHPHRFNSKRGVPKGYDNGFICDGCGANVTLVAESSFVHCSCGMDMCSACEAAYVAKCTCDCGKRLPNMAALAKHEAARACVKRPHAAPVPATSMQHPATERRPFQPVVAINEQRCAFDGMVSKRVRLEGAVMPTPDEQRALLQGDWVRYYHAFPEGGAGQALTYHIQPGRTGAIFHSNEIRVHSAIVSVIERQCYVVDRIDVAAGDDTVFVMTLEAAKVQLPREVELVQAAAFHDNKQLKWRRAPGVMSVYQVPTTAVRCFGDPVVYVRWVLADPDHRITVMSLSNGHMQVFLDESYEIRWLHSDERKFCVHGNGRCELINEVTCDAMQWVNALLDHTLSYEEGSHSRVDA